MTDYESYCTDSTQQNPKVFYGILPGDTIYFHDGYCGRGKWGIKGNKNGPYAVDGLTILSYSKYASSLLSNTVLWNVKFRVDAYIQSEIKIPGGYYDSWGRIQTHYTDIRPNNFVWNGGQWLPGKVYVWNGSAWQSKAIDSWTPSTIPVDVSVWNGSAWK